MRVSAKQPFVPVMSIQIWGLLIAIRQFVGLWTPKSFKGTIVYLK